MNREFTIADFVDYEDFFTEEELVTPSLIGEEFIDFICHDL